ncbi:MAG: hypothetical protein AAGA54_05690 [Myxococcota bacterium]
MANLSEDELREAAAEAGISPQELRVALAEREGNLPATTDAASAVGALTRGVSSGHVEGRVVAPPPQALHAVRTSLERQTGKTGHGQGEGQADVVDGDIGLTYKVRATSDGADGALVRVDVDTSAGRGVQQLAATGVTGVTVTMLALGWLFGATTLLFGGLSVGAIGAALIVRNLAKLRSGAARAQAIASQALLEAEDQAERTAALPPGRV